MGLTVLSSDDEQVAKKGPGRLDAIGACLSFACAIHCIMLPLVITILPFIGLQLFAEFEFERIIIAASVSIAAISFIMGFRLHKERKPIFYLSLAILFFVTAHIFEHDVHWIFMGVGGGILALGHLINRKLCRTCPSCCSGGICSG